MTIAQTLQSLGITLQAPPKPAAAYLPFVVQGNTVYISGHISRQPGGAPWTGKFGQSLRTQDGVPIARQVAIDLLGTLQAACGGDLERLRRIVKVVSLVNSTPDFTEQHLVTNGCSELLGQVLGERGQHARSAFGVASLPLGAAVEIELVAEIHPASA